MDLADIALIKLHKEEVSSQGTLDESDDDEIVKITFPNETSAIKRKSDINVGASDCFYVLRDTLLQGYIDPTFGREYNVNRLKQFALLNTGYPSIPLKGIFTTSQMQYFMRMWDTQKHMRWENKMTNLFGQLLSLTDNDSVEGVKGLWELAMRDECLPFFTDDVLAALVDSFEESEQEEVHWCAYILHSAILKVKNGYSHSASARFAARISGWQIRVSDAHVPCLWDNCQIGHVQISTWHMCSTNSKQQTTNCILYIYI
jgi:hypothetical protein